MSIGKVVNPLGTVTTITESPQESINAANEFSEEYSSGAYIHENCDESMFRPYVAVISGTIDGESGNSSDIVQDRPEPIGQKLIVPVIDAAELERDRQKALQNEYERQEVENIAKFEQMSLLNKKDNKNQKGKGKDNEVSIKETKEPRKDPVEVRKRDDNSNTNTVETAAMPEMENVTVKIKKKSGKIAAKFDEARSTDEPKSVAAPLSSKKDSSENISKSKVELKSDSLPPQVEVSPRAQRKVIEPSRSSDKDKSPSVDDKKFVKKSWITEENKRNEESKMGANVDFSEKPKPTERTILSQEKCKKSDEYLEKEISTSSTSDENAKSKKNNKKQKKYEKLVNEAACDDAKDETIEYTINLKEKFANKSPANEPSQNDFTMLDEYKSSLDADCSHIQESLLKNPVVSATFSVRKGSIQEKDEFIEINEIKPISSRSNKKKYIKTVKDNEADKTVQLSHVSLNINDVDETLDFTFPESTERTPDLDSLSFKSTTDDPISLINFESPQQDTSESITERTNEYDKLSDDIEVYPDNQFSDCKSFQLVIDETETYLKSSDTNSSDETEDSSQGKSSKSEKTIEDEELQPLISSNVSQSDTTVDLSKTDALPDEINESDAMESPLDQQQHQKQQPQQQQQTNNNSSSSNSRKKYRKKRR